MKKPKIHYNRIELKSCHDIIKDLSDKKEKILK